MDTGMGMGMSMGYGLWVMGSRQTIRIDAKGLNHRTGVDFGFEKDP